MTIFQRLRLYPLITVTICYILGLFFSNSFQYSLVSVLFLLFFGIAILLFFHRKKENVAMSFLVLFFLQIGILSGNIIHTTPTEPYHVLNLIDQHNESIVLGKIKRIYGFDGEKTRFDVASFSIRDQKNLYQHCTGTIRYTLKAKLPPSFLPGNTVAIRARLKRPSKFLTPGSFDYPKYLTLRGIKATGHISSPLYIQQVRSDTSFSEKLFYSPEILREKIKLFIESSLPADTAALYKALITGDRSSISQEVVEQFRGSGCLHILAISGIHMSLLGLFFYTIIYWLLRRSTRLILTINTKKTAMLLCIIPLVLYSLIAGGQTPVVRSLIMSLIVILAVCSERKHSLFTLIACAALLILTISPTELFAPSFQLTFTAVLAIALTVTPLKTICTSFFGARDNKTFFHTFLVWLFYAIGVSIAATVGTAPLLIYHFNQMSLIGPLANLVIEPIICLWSLTVGFIATLFIFIFPAIAALLFKAGAIGLILATKCAFFFNAFSFSSVRLPTPSILQICIYYLSLFLLLHFHQYRRYIRNYSVVLFIISVFLFFNSPTELLKKRKQGSTVAILDVGHGSAVFLELPHGKRFLIDGGAISSPSFNIGERVIAPFLWDKGITTLEDIVITHTDSDHYNGIPFIIKHFGVKRLWINGSNKHSIPWQHLLQLANEHDIVIQVPATGAQLGCSKGACIELLANTYQDFSKSVESTTNEESLVLKFTHGNFSAIFPGDIPSSIEKKLLRKGTDLKATVLLAAHHGSATSNSKMFLKEISPQYLIVSSSRYNFKNFKGSELSSNCNELGVKIIYTAESGTTSVITTGEKFSLSTYLQHKYRL